MTQKDKELLLKDLCAKLPYGVKVTTNNFHNLTLLSINPNGIAEVIPNNGYPMEINWEDCKPYLFPLSSMTEKQKKEYCSLQQKVIYNSKGLINSDVMEYVNWCYKNHIDVNNLIPMGLAIDATELNIY